MAFFGEDGLQRQLKQAQRDLMEKDREIGTMFLASKEKDESLKKLRLEVERLQEERDELANNGTGSSSASNANNAAEKSRLKAELKEAQDALNKASMENNKLREEARQTSLNLNDARLRKVSGSSSSSSSLASPPSHRSRRRSTSLSADTRVKDLEAELTMLRQSAGSPALEIDGLKSQLANVRRELNKAINEKIAIETRSKKEVEGVKCQLDDANFELDNIRRDLEDGGSVSKKEVEKRQRSWEGEKAGLLARVGDLEGVVADTKAQISTMKASTGEVARLQAELDQERSERNSAPPPLEASVEVARLTEEMTSLKQELTRARAQTPTSVSSSSSSDLTIRRLERKLEKAQRDAEALEDSLNQAEEENQALRSRVPLPGSPGRKVDGGKLMALEEEKENLQGELADLRAQLAQLQAQMEETRAAHDTALSAEKASTAAAVAERHLLAEQMDSIKQAQSLVEERCQTQIQDIEAKSAQIAVLSLSLATSEARIVDLTSQLNSAEAGRLSNQVGELENTVETLTKQRQVAVGTASRLETEIGSLQRELSESQDDLRTERAGMAVAQIQLDELSEQNTILTTDLEELQDRLELAVNEKQDLEQLLSEAQAKEADRSTESESDSRNMELVKLKSDLNDALRALEAKEGEMQKELELLAFVKDTKAKETQERITVLEQEITAAQAAYKEKESALQDMVDKLQSDLEASRAAIAVLESSVSTSEADLQAAKTSATPASGTDHLGQLYTKIQSLRSERDDLRQALSFAQNESRFTIRAAQADRESAIEELEKVKRDLNSQWALHESLEAEVSSVRTQLHEKEAKLEDVKSLYAGAAIENGDVADQITQLESEVSSAKAEREHLVKQLSESPIQIMELNHALVISRTDAETDMRNRKISMERRISALAEMPRITETSNGVAIDRASASMASSRRPVHSRTKSEIANLVLPDQAQITALTARLVAVESELKVVSGKLERRNATIAALQRENEKLKMAEELSKESAEDFEELVIERDSLQAQVDQRNLLVSALQEQVETAANQLETHISRHAVLDETINSLRSELTTSQADATQRAEHTAELERCILHAQKELQEASAANEISQQTIERVHATSVTAGHEFATQLHSSIISVLSQRQRLSLAARAWRTASHGLQHQTTCLATANAQVKALSVQVDAFEAEREAMSQQSLSHTQRAKALDTANEKIRELESTVETLEAECVAMTEQIDLNVNRQKELQEQFNARSTDQHALDEATARAEQLTLALSEVQGRVADYEQAVATVRYDLNTALLAKDELEANLTRQLGLVKEELVAFQASASEVETRATADRQGMETEISTLKITIDGLTRDVEVKTTEIDALAKTCETLRTTITDLETRAAEASSSTGELTTLQSENADLQKQLDSVSVKTAALRIEVSSTISKNQQLKLELAKLTDGSLADKASLAEIQEAASSLQDQVEQLKEKDHKATGMIKYLEAEKQSGANKLASLVSQLRDLKTEFATSQELCNSQKAEMTRLESESSQLRDALEAAQSRSAANDNAELKERIEELEAALTLKTQEVDEADDRTREAFKANAKLEKKIAKLNRQLGDKELEANTKRNKVIAIPEPAPAPVAVYKQMAPPRPVAALSDRTPLRPVDNLEPAAIITSTPGSLKRVREGDEDQKPLPAEAIMLPPSAPASVTSKTPNRRSFTPKRNIGSGAENADIRRNIFGGGVVGARPNVFASRSPEL